MNEAMQERHFKLRYDMTKKTEDNKTLYRIEATRDSLHAYSGEIGGWVEGMQSIRGDKAWVGGESEVYNGSTVGGSALVDRNAVVRNNSRILGNGLVSGHGVVDSACVFEKGIVRGRGVVENGAGVIGEGIVEGRARLSKGVLMGKSVICEDVIVDQHLIINTEDIIKRNSYFSIEEMLEREKEKQDLHFKLTKNVMITEDGEILYQIKATKETAFKDISISAGETGGFVSSLDSLKNGAWVEKGTNVAKNVQIDGIYLNSGKTIGTEDDIAVSKAITKNAQIRKVKELAQSVPIQITM